MADLRRLRDFLFEREERDFLEAFLRLPPSCGLEPAPLAWLDGGVGSEGWYCAALVGLLRGRGNKDIKWSKRLLYFWAHTRLANGYGK